MMVSSLHDKYQLLQMDLRDALAASRVSCCRKNVDKLAVDRRKYCQRIVHPTMVQFIAVSVQFWRAMLTLRCNDQRAVAKFSVQTPEFG